MEDETRIKEETLRYLGYRGQDIDDNLNRLIDNTIMELKSLIKWRYNYKRFDLNKDGKEISLKGTNFFLPGEDIKSHLKDSSDCILMAATLGHDVDTKIRYYEKVDMTRALILDAAATTFIEEFCDKLCQEVEEDLLLTNKTLTSRYSPGYGDLTIEIQNELLRVLDSQRAIGLTASSNSVLIPRKSVTAIIGIIKREEKQVKIENQNSCLSCNKFNTCNFSRGGKAYGY